jgi:glutamate N-acetyltransferase / amino-acid N-acetyltransferase
LAVNLVAPDVQFLYAVPGIELGVATAGLRKTPRNDLLVMRLAPGSSVAGVFTRNRFCAAPVILAKKNLESGATVRALVINAGNANAGTGKEGLEAAAAVCASLAKSISCSPEQVLPFSTGVIMEQLPAQKIVTALPQALARNADWLAAAEAIMTTDTVAKAFSRKVRLSTGVAVVTGIAKGSGMIHPDMATLLGFVATDAAVSPRALEKFARSAADRSFNCVTVDGDTSTNDSFILVATGRGPSASSSRDAALLGQALTEVAQQLAWAIVRDGEGATKFVTIVVEGGRSKRECRQVAYAIAHSPLVKTAFFASDPNLGRILAAVGYAGVKDLDTGNVDLYIDEYLVVRQGGRNPSYLEEQGTKVMEEPEFTVKVALNRGKARATIWTCDLSFDYVKINAEYRT